MKWWRVNNVAIVMVLAVVWDGGNISGLVGVLVDLVVVGLALDIG